MSILAGDRYNRGWNMIPCVAASGYTPHVGDAVKRSAGAAAEVNIISSNDATWGLVDVVGADGVLTVAVLVPGTQVEYPTSATATLGQHVKFNSSTRPASTSVQRTVMTSDASNGNGTIIAVGADCPHGVGHAVVEY